MANANASQDSGTAILKRGRRPRPTAGPTDRLPIADVTRRVGADLIDVAILAAIFTVLVLLLPDVFYELGPSARVFSFLAGVTYFGYFSSAYGRGQTPGKRLLRLQVVDDAGDLLTLSAALRRSIILFAIPAFRDLGSATASPLASAVQDTIFVGGILALLYAYLFNNDTRQGPHDLLSGSYVVNWPLEKGAYSPPERSMWHRNIMLSLAVLGLAIGLGSAFVAANSQYRDLFDELNEGDEFFEVDVGRDGDRLQLRAWDEDECRESECAGLSANLVLTALRNFDDVDELATIEVEIFRQADMYFGFINNRDTVYAKEASVAEWREDIARRLFAEGTEYVIEENYRAAIGQFDQALAVQPGFVEAYANRGLAHLALGNEEQARRDLLAYQELAGEEADPDIRQLISELESEPAEEGVSDP
jgi:uncharacterized RDD family membrane protein YckC